MKNNNGEKIITIFFIVLLIISVLINFALTNDLNDCRQSSQWLKEACDENINYLSEDRNLCNTDLNKCNEDSEFLEKIMAYQNRQILLTKDRCPICPTDEVCIKVVKENKFQCINREFIGGN